MKTIPFSLILAAVLLTTSTGCAAFSSVLESMRPSAPLIVDAIGRWERAAIDAGASPEARGLACACDQAETNGDAQAFDEATRRLLASLSTEMAETVKRLAACCAARYHVPLEPAPL